MNFLFITTYDTGGAGTATLRMHKALLEKGHTSAVLVKQKTINDDSIVSIDQIFPPSKISILGTKVRNKLRSYFPTVDVTDKDYCFYTLDEREFTVDFRDHGKKFPFTPDVIIACWTSAFLNFQSLSSLQFETKAKLYWWGLDMSPLTGGCHYAWGCTGYTKDCSFCPAIKEDKYKEYPFRNLTMRKHYSDESGMRFIAGSDSLYQQAKKSFLFHGQHKLSKVLMCIDDKIFNPVNRAHARESYGLESHNKVIFYGSTFTGEKRKGIDHFIKALVLLKQKLEDNERNDLSEQIVVFLVGNQLSAEKFSSQIPFKTKFLDFIHGDENLATLYKASDVFVCTSLEDSGPMMINESVMCGTPVVTFNIGVSNDLIENGVSGYKATIFETEEIAEGVYKILSLSDSEYVALSKSTTEFASRKTSKQAVVQDMLNAVSLK